MLCERVFSTLKLSTHIWTRRKRSGWQTILSIPCHEARSANFFFPAFLVKRANFNSHRFRLNLKRKQEARKTIFSAVDAGTRREAQEFFGFRAFLVNLRRGHKARSAKKIFPETRGAGTAPRKEKRKKKKKKRKKKKEKKRKKNNNNLFSEGKASVA